MTRRRTPTVLLAAAGGVLSLTSIAAIAAAPAIDLRSRVPAARYAEGAPPGFAGGFGESSCHACHFDFDVNTPPGTLTITGLPDRFEPGARYPLTIELSRPGMKIAGFQLSARLEKGGAQAGALIADEKDAERVIVETQSGVQYASQKKAGTTPGASGSAVWHVVWTAPSAGGAIQIHVAANAADLDGTVSGDYVYTAVARTQP